MKTPELIKILEGLHTLETAAEVLGISQQSTLNLLTRLKKEQHVTVSGRCRQKRLYKITLYKQLPRQLGMFDIINKYSPNFQVNPWYDHQVHGSYGPEEALIDALQTDSFRLILASMHLFNHIKDWSKFYQLAKKKNCWQKVGALYDIARMFMKVRKMPAKYRQKSLKKKIIHLINDYPTKEERFLPVEKFWKVAIPFRLGDLKSLLEFG